MPSSLKRAALRARSRDRLRTAPKAPPEPVIPREDDLRDQRAEAIFAFFSELYGAADELEVHVNRTRILDYLDAFRSQRFMDLVEASELPYDVKVNFSGLNSALNKAWPSLRQFVGAPSVERMAAVGYLLTESLEQVLGALEIDVKEPTENGVGPSADA